MPKFQVNIGTFPSTEQLNKASEFMSMVIMQVLEYSFKNNEMLYVCSVDLDTLVMTILPDVSLAI